MSELIADLKQSLISPDEDFVKVADSDEEASTRMITDRDMVQIKRQSENRDSMDEAMRLKKDVRDRERDRDDDRYYEDDEDEDWDDEEDYDPKMEKITTILAVVAALLIGCILIFLVGRTMGVFNFGAANDELQAQEKEQVEMIRVVGMHVDEAKKALLDLGLTPEIKYEENSNYDAGTVLRASVQDGLMIDKGTNIILTVAEAVEGVQVPNVTGKSQTEAESVLTKEGFVVTVVESPDATVEKGVVISQSPEAETKAAAGSNITIRVSQGAEDNKVRVPRVVDMTEMDATAVLTESGLVVGTVTQVENEETEPDLVCYQSYSEGSYVDKGTAVDLRISAGPSQKTYRYSEGITAPTEDPSYQSGMEVAVELIAYDGTVILSTRTTTFPVGGNYTGIKSPSGVIRYTFTVQTEPTTVTNPETGEQTTEGGGSETKTVERQVNFTEE